MINGENIETEGSCRSGDHRGKGKREIIEGSVCSIFIAYRSIVLFPFLLLLALSQSSHPAQA